MAFGKLGARGGFGSLGVLGGVSNSPGPSDFVVIAGQSNAVGQVNGSTGLPAGWSVSSRVQMWNGSAFANYNPAGASNWGSEVNFAQSWLNDTANTGRTLYLVKSAVNGTQLGAIATYGQTPGTTNTPDWYPDTVGGLYTTMKNSVNAAKTALAGLGQPTTVKAILWLQGESDSSQLNTAAAYQTNLQYFISKCRTDLGSNIKFLIARMSQDPFWTFKQQVRYAQGYIPTTDSKSFMIDADTCNRISGNVLHYNQSGLNALGATFYQVYARTFSFSSFTMPGSSSGSCSTATQNGTVIATFQPVGGSPTASVSLSGTMSAALVVDPQLGTISIADASQLSAGSYAISVIASNGVNTASTTLNLTVSAGAVANLLEQSQKRSLAPWVPTGLASVTPNALLAPDGTTTADKLTQDTSTINHRVSQTVYATGGSTLCYSDYLQKGTANYALLTLYDGTTTYGGVFDLNAGTYLGTATGFSAPTNPAIAVAANGFYRCSIAGTIGANASTAQVQTTVKNSSSLSPTETGTSTYIYAWGAMLNAGTSPATYQSAFSTNFAIQSEGFEQAAWTATNSTFTPFAAQGPQGLSTADVVAQTTGSSNHRVTQTANVIGGSTLTYSHKLKQNGARYAALGLYDGTSNFYGIFDLQAGTYLGDSVAGGTVAPSGHAITADANGYYICSITATVAAGATTAQMQATVKSTSALTPIDNGSTSNTLNMCGAALNYGSSPATYLKTGATPV